MSDEWLNHLNASLTASGQVAYTWHVEEDRISWFGDPATVLGFSDNSLPGTLAELSGCMNPQDVPARLSAIHEAISPKNRARNPAATISLRIRASNGRQFSVRETVTVAYDPVADKTLLRGVFSVVAAAASPESEAPSGKAVAAFGFSSSIGRTMLKESIGQWLERQTGAETGRGYFLAVGIDRLSLFNEAFGTHHADMLIEKTGERLARLMGESAVIGRLFGGTFGIFMPYAPAGEMAATARHVLNGFYEMPILTQWGPTNVTVSAGGISLQEKVATDPATIIAKAEHALRIAKEKGRGCFVPYRDLAGMSREYRGLLQIGDGFLRALNTGGIRLAFQPVVDSRSRKVSFHECLVRMIDEQGTVHNAGQFVPAVEQLGLSRLLDTYTVKLAIEELKMFPDISLSVNVTNWTLTDDNWLKGVVESLRGYPEVANRLIIEITESVIMQDIDHSARFIDTLRDLGCRIALDDFGSGSTAFSQLQRLDIDIVKIDKSFVRNMKDRDGRLFINALQALAEGVDIETVGEGAETLAEANVLANGGIDHIQGFCYGRPSVERLWLPADHEHRSGDSRNAALHSDIRKEQM